jgi:hypothetical protein
MRCQRDFAREAVSVPDPRLRWCGPAPRVVLTRPVGLEFAEVIGEKGRPWKISP